jgi:hypothetical protein
MTQKKKKNLSIYAHITTKRQKKNPPFMPLLALDKTKKNKRKNYSIFVFHKVNRTKRNKKGVVPSLLFFLCKKWHNLSIYVLLTISNWTYYHPQMH